MHYVLSCTIKRSVIFNSECTIEQFVGRVPRGPTGGAHTAPHTPKLDRRGVLGQDRNTNERKGKEWKCKEGKAEGKEGREETRFYFQPSCL